MKRIGRNFLIAIALLFAAYFFSIDYLLKALIEREGSAALRAKLDIGSVTFHLLPTSIRLNAVQVTNPQQPLRNIIAFESLSTPLDIGALSTQKLNAQRIDLPEVELHGLRFNTERVQSGAIAGVTPVDTDSAGASPLANAQQLAAQQKQQMQNALDQTQQDLTVMLDKWQQRLQQLPSDSRIGDYQQRALALRSGNKAAELAQLHQQLSNELGGVRKLADEFAMDMQHARSQLGYAQQLPQGGAANFAANSFGTGAPANVGNIAGLLLGAEFSNLLQPLLRQLPALLAAESDAAPTLLIRKLTLDGQFDLGSQPLQFTGSVENLTAQPKLWNVASRFALDGVAAQPSKFSARGNADLRKTTSIDMRFDLREFPLQQLTLSKNPQLGIVVKHAIADIQGLLSSTGNQIDVNLLSRFQQAALQIQAGNDATAQAVAAALQDVTDFDINFQASGDIQKPQFKLDSNLNQRIAAAINQLQNQPAVSAGASSLQQQLAPNLTGFQQLAAQFDDLQRQLSAKQAALQSIMDM